MRRKFLRNVLNFVYDAITDKQLGVELTGFAIYCLNFLTTFCTEMELMGFATINNSKSVRSTNSKFARKKDIGVTIEKMQKRKRNFKIFGVNGSCQMTAENRAPLFN